MQSKLKRKRILCLLLIAVWMNTLIISASAASVTATTILPPGSTSVDLQTAINNTVSGDTVELSGDMDFSGVVTVPSGKEITIRSDSGNHWIMKEPTAGTRHFQIKGSLILQDITLDGGSNAGGVQVDNTGSLTMNGGATIQNCASALGGGIYVYAGGKFTLNGGTVTKNSALGADISTGNGGGIYNYGTIVIHSGTISYNTATNYGGGLMQRSSTSMIINGGHITNNTANYGGGIALGSSAVTINGGNFSNNNAVTGGGIYLVGSAMIFNDGSVSQNKASYYAGGINVYANSAVTFNHGTVSNNQGPNGGGICIGTSSSFTMNGGTITGNTGTSGGGVQVNATSSFTMANGTITDNAATSGGGVYVTNSLFQMNGGIINTNTAGNGGGVYVANGTFNTDGAAISNNSARSNGGGVMISDGAFTLTNAMIDHNTANNNGGGVYLSTEAQLHILESSAILSNTALAGHGGGIYTANVLYTNLHIADGTEFSGNQAKAIYIPPPDARTVYANIGFASTSVMEHPLNDYDINYQTGKLLTYHVTYVANGGAGNYEGPELNPGESDTVLDSTATGISYDGYTFMGWNTQPNGSGDAYAPDDLIVLNDNVTLYAQWTPNSTPIPPWCYIILVCVLLTILAVICLLFWNKKKYCNQKYLFW